MEQYMKTRTEEYLKGDMALIKVMESLVKQGFIPLIPFGEQYSFDIVALNPKTNEHWRLQSKYMGSGRMQLDDGKHWTGRRTSCGYDDNSFDFYACYIPSIDAVIFPSIKYRGKRITIKGTKTHLSHFYWYEDFLELKNCLPEKRSRESIGLEKPKWLTRDKTKSHKVRHPSKEELEKMVWSKPMTELSREFGVRDNAIRKWCHRYGITYPTCGYWQRIRAGHSHEDALHPIIKEKQPIKKLTNEQVEQILLLLQESKMSLKKIATKVGSNPTTVMYIRDGKAYKHVPRIVSF